MPSASRRYRRIAPFYDLLELPFEYGRYRRLRRRVFDGLSGRILDAGIGTGRNVEFYPQGAKVVGIDISPAMLARAERRLRPSPATTVELREMDVTRLDFPAGSFDVAVDGVGLRRQLRPQNREVHARSGVGARQGRVRRGRPCENAHRTGSEVSWIPQVQAL